MMSTVRSAYATEGTRMSASRRISGFVVMASMLMATSAQRLAFADEPKFDAQHCPPATPCGPTLLTPGCSCYTNTEVTRKCSDHKNENGETEQWCREIIKGPPDLPAPPGC